MFYNPSHYTCKLQFLLHNSQGRGRPTAPLINSIRLIAPLMPINWPKYLPVIFGQILEADYTEGLLPCSLGGIETSGIAVRFFGRSAVPPYSSPLRQETVKWSKIILAYMIRPAVLDPIEVPYLKKDSREKLFLAPFCLNENFTTIWGKSYTLKIKDVLSYQPSTRY
jgi:hypothetical protein